MPGASLVGGWPQKLRGEQALDVDRAEYLGTVCLPAFGFTHHPESSGVPVSSIQCVLFLPPILRLPKT